MTSALTSFASKAYESLPTLKLDTPSNIVRKTTAIAVPVLTFAALSSLSQVAADPYVNCINACDRIEAPVAKLLCYALCLFAK